MHDSCAITLSDALSRARGQTLLKSVVVAVASRQQSRLTEIAKLIYRSAPVTKSLLERLLSVGLILKQGNMFSIADPVLRLYIKYASIMADTTVLDDSVLSELKKETEDDING